MPAFHLSLPPSGKDPGLCPTALPNRPPPPPPTTLSRSQNQTYAKIFLPRIVQQSYSTRGADDSVYGTFLRNSVKATQQLYPVVTE